jgi:DNA-binding transcriptional ArsR family regulator
MRRRHFSSNCRPDKTSHHRLNCIAGNDTKRHCRNFNTTRQAISKHLRILTECKLVKQEQQGREIYYSLEIDKMKEIEKWLEQFKKIWETKFNQLRQSIIND